MGGTERGGLFFPACFAAAARSAFPPRTLQGSKQEFVFILHFSAQRRQAAPTLLQLAREASATFAAAAQIVT